MKDADEYEKLWRSGAFDVDKKPPTPPTQAAPNPNTQPQYPPTPIKASSSTGKFPRSTFLWLLGGGLGALSIGALSREVDKILPTQKYFEEIAKPVAKTTPSIAPAQIVPPPEVVKPSIFQVVATQEAAKPTSTPIPPTATPIPKPTPVIVQEQELLVSEKAAWKTALGADVEIKPLPEYLSPEIRRNIVTGEFKLVYLPAIDIGTKKDLDSFGVRKYLDVLKRNYPNWVQFKEPFWEAVRSGDVNFPSLPGQWAAYETLTLPGQWAAYETPSKAYDTSPLEKIYKHEPFSGLEESLKDKKFQILEYFGLSEIDTGPLISLGFSKRKVDIHLLEALEWNLIANREKWDSKDFLRSEWTMTRWGYIPGLFHNQDFRVRVGRGRQDYYSYSDPTVLVSSLAVKELAAGVNGVGVMSRLAIYFDTK